MSRADGAATDRETGFASRILAWPLSLMLGSVALAQLAIWVPHYLTWPYWADHDVFAAAARAWDRGEKPYRDIRLNNFPGTIYAFYLLGKLGGWGRTWTFYALDAALLMAWVVLLVAWSRRTFQCCWPGLVGGLAFLSYYLGLDYSHAAQRDWQAPALAVAGLLVTQGWRGRAGGIGSALLTALGFSIRPQIVLFLPAILLAVWWSGDREESKAQSFRRTLVWLLTFAGLAALTFLPLAIDGTFGDFLRSLRRVALGSSYNKATPASVAKAWLSQATAFRWLVVPAGILLLAPGTGRSKRAWSWLLALAGASLYKPLSPMAHSYLEIPMVLVWSVNLAVLAGLIGARPDAPATIRLAGVLTLLGMGTTTLRPEFAAIGPTLRAVATLRTGSAPEPEPEPEPVTAPPGYRHGTVPTSAYYPWADLRDTLIYLRTRTSPSTKVANALRGDPAIVSTVDRRSAFPAESIAWLQMVDVRDEPTFVESLEKATDSVVVWVPGEVGLDPKFHVAQLDDAIRRLYRFEARFGAIEVWRRGGPPP